MFSEFLKVRGTPASGKSTLAMLLGRYIRIQEPMCVLFGSGGGSLMMWRSVFPRVDPAL